MAKNLQYMYGTPFPYDPDGDHAMEGLVSPDEEAPADDDVAWAVERWNAEVKNRPLVNIHRRSLDDTWRQVMRHFGADPDMLCGPSHDELLEGEGHE